MFCHLSNYFCVGNFRGYSHIFDLFAHGASSTSMPMLFKNKVTCFSKMFVHLLNQTTNVQWKLQKVRKFDKKSQSCYFTFVTRLKIKFSLFLCSKRNTEFLFFTIQFRCFVVNLFLVLYVFFLFNESNNEVELGP